MAHSSPLAIMIKETEIAMASMDVSDADERQAILQTCGLTLAAIKDPGERLSQAENYAVLLVQRCTMRSSKALDEGHHHAEGL